MKLRGKTNPQKRLVIELSYARYLAGHGGGEENFPAARCFHARQKRPRHVRCSQGIHAEQALDFGRSQFFKLPCDGESRTVGQNLISMSIVYYTGKVYRQVANDTHISCTQCGRVARCRSQERHKTHEVFDLTALRWPIGSPHCISVGSSCSERFLHRAAHGASHNTAAGVFKGAPGDVTMFHENAEKHHLLHSDACCYSKRRRRPVDSTRRMLPSKKPRTNKQNAQQQ